MNGNDYKEEYNNINNTANINGYNKGLLGIKIKTLTRKSAYATSASMKLSKKETKYKKFTDHPSYNQGI